MKMQVSRFQAKKWECRLVVWHQTFNLAKRGFDSHRSHQNYQRNKNMELNSNEHSSGLISWDYLMKEYGPSIHTHPHEQGMFYFLLKAPSKSHATDYYHKLIRHWFKVGPRSGRGIPWHDTFVVQIANAYGFEKPRDTAMQKNCVNYVKM